MFPRNNRLKREELQTPLPRRRVVSTYFSAAVPPHGRGYAVIIPKKVLRRAVDRHRLKRRVMAVLSHIDPQPAPQGLIIFPKASALTLPPNEFQEDLNSLLSQL